MPDYRALIEQVQNRGGPLRLEMEDLPDGSEAWDVCWGPNAVRLHTLPDDDRVDEREVLCGVLRRDLHLRKHNVYTYEYTTPKNEVRYRVVLYDWDHNPLTPNGFQYEANDPLTAHLRAWLEAVPEEPTRGP